MDAGLLRSFLRRSGWDVDLTVLMLPWEWRAARGLVGRVVFDCTDDWARLLPHARGLPAQLRRIADEADEVIVVNRVLAGLFPGREPVVVPNGADQALLDAPRVVERRERSAVYVGSISERFDVDLVAAVLTALPDWTLTVHGQLVFPLRAQASGIALGQSSMKAYDYCARGVPVVATAGHLEHSSDVPPHTSVVAGADEMATALPAAAGEPTRYATERTAWAVARTWDRRTDRWLAAALGDRVAGAPV